MRMTTFPPTATDEPESLRAPHFRQIGPVAPQDGAYWASRDDRLDGRHSESEVAALSTEAIQAMSRSEMIAVIRSVRGRHLLPGVLERLPQMDGDTLRKLVFLTRRYCRNQQLLSDPEPSPNTVAAYCG